MPDSSNTAVSSKEKTVMSWEKKKKKKKKNRSIFFLYFSRFSQLLSQYLRNFDLTTIHQSRKLKIFV